MYITEGTVKTHVTHILAFLKLRNRSQLAIFANAAFRYNIYFNMLQLIFIYLSCS
ncbi:LuxR C-terminal-related transcriptional regulator [Microcoleus sp. F4-D5]|uniref:LuxR C-terminal-related transcriptional regulator n=1 Tax=Microcoleus sp. F4-D5 TaxID=2818760 RepID=UPI002FD2B665